MIQQLHGRPALTGVLLQHASHEVVEVRGPRGGVLEGGRGLRHDAQHRLHSVVDVRVRGDSVRHLQNGDAERPDVRRPVVGRATNHLRRHPVRRSHQRRALRALLREHDGTAEVGDLDVTVLVQKDVDALDVYLVSSPRDYLGGSRGAGACREVPSAPRGSRTRWLLRGTPPACPEGPRDCLCPDTP